MDNGFTRKQVLTCLGLAALAHVVGFVVGLPLSLAVLGLFSR